MAQSIEKYLHQVFHTNQFTILLTVLCSECTEQEGEACRDWRAGGTDVALWGDSETVSQVQAQQVGVAAECWKVPAILSHTGLGQSLGHHFPRFPNHSGPSLETEIWELERWLMV